MIKKLSLFILTLFLMFSGVFALNADSDLIIHTPLYNNASDISGNGNDGTNNGATFNGSEADFAGGTAYITFPNLAGTIDYRNETLNFWVKGDSTRAVNEFFWTENTGSSFLAFLTTDVLRSDIESSTSLDDGVVRDDAWHMVTIVFSQTKYRLYVDNVSIGNQTITAGSPGYTMRLGTRSDGINGLIGQMKDFSYWTRPLTVTEVSDLYANDIVYVPPSTLVLNANFTNNSYFNTQNLNVSGTFNITGGNLSDIDIYYKLDNGAYTFIPTTDGAGILELTNLSETSHTIQFWGWNANNTINETTGAYTFTIDITEPTIDNNILGEYNYYTILGFNSSCSDVNLNYCNISLDSQNVALNTSSFTFSVNGNISYTITAMDLAGNNVTDSGVIFVNPYQYFYFEDSVTTPLTNFYIDDVLYSNNYTFKVYDFGIGSHSVEFEKTGYTTQTINFNLTNTSALNETYAINDARIVLYIKDKDTGNLITTETFNVDFIATVGVNTTTSTGIVNLTNTLFLDESYTAIITNADYQTETIYFDFSNKEILELNAYMIETNNSNFGVVFIKPVDRFSQPITGAIVKALQWDSSTSTYKEVSQAATGSDGLGAVNVILNDKVYLFSASFGGVTGLTDFAEVIDSTENGKTITITLSSAITEQFYLLENLETIVTETYNNITNTSLIDFYWNDNEGLIQTACISGYRIIGTSKALINRNCTTGVSGQFSLNFLINNSYTTELAAEIKVGESYYTIKKFTYQPQGTPSKVLEDIGLSMFIVPILVLMGIAIGMYLENVYIGTFAMIVFMGLSLTLAPNVLTKGIVAFLFFIGWLTITYGVKPR